MDIKLDLYRVFAAVAREMSFSKGAKSLFITQSAASQSIKHLEDCLGTKLFLRDNKTISLTQEGELLYEYTQNALSLIDKAEQEILKVVSGEQGNLRIGASDTISRWLLLPYLENFSRTYPMVNLQIVNRTSLQAVELLKQGKIDLAFVNLPLQDDSIQVQNYVQVQDLFVAGSRFQFLYGKTVSLEELTRLPLILLEKAANSRGYVDEFFLSHGLKITPEIELGSHDLVLEFAKINLGIGCVIQEFSKGYLEEEQLFALELSEPIPPRWIGICTLKGVSISSAGKAFLAMLNRRRLLGKSQASLGRSLSTDSSKFYE
ncbi:MAG: LysR family transcriptional regulator [Massiliimalia sp.]|jgi:DNA-binding transcriptional LysR family regulator